MFESFIDFARTITGSNLTPNQLEFGHLCVRVLLVLIEGLIIARLNHRLIGRNNSFDFIIRVIIGTLLATAIMGTPFFEILALVPIISLANMVLVIIASYHPAIDYIIKGPTPTLIEEGEIKWHIMRYHLISKEDLMEAVRESNLSHIKEVRRAILEKDGKISVQSYK